MSEFILAFQFGNRGSQTETGGVPIPKHQQIFIYKFCKYVFIAKTDSQKESRSETQLKYKKPEEKQKGNGRKMQISTPVLVCFGVFQFFFSAFYGKTPSGCNLAKINY